MSCLNLNIFVLKSRYSYKFKTIFLTVIIHIFNQETVKHLQKYRQTSAYMVLNNTTTNFRQARPPLPGDVVVTAFFSVKSR